MKVTAMLLALCGSAVAQVPAARAATGETDLHTAWLGELLDLDAGAAARTYRNVATDTRAVRGKRIVALARVHELERIGATQPESIILEQLDVPQDLREVGDPRETRKPFDRLVEQVVTNLQGVQAWLLEQGERTAQFQARPFVQLVYTEALDTSSRERRRQLRLQLEEAVARNDLRLQPEIRQKLRLLAEPEVRAVQRSRALHVLNHELAGKRDKAAYLRAIWFPYQRATTPPAKPEEAWEQVKANLQLFMNSQDLYRGEAEPMRQLQALLQKIAADKGPAAAIQELDRLPFYRTQFRGREGR